MRLLNIPKCLSVYLLYIKRILISAGNKLFSSAYCKIKGIPKKFWDAFYFANLSVNNVWQ
jgi:hypothetical protein